MHMVYVQPGSLTITPFNPKDNNALTFRFVAHLDFIDSTHIFGTTLYIMYKPSTQGSSQYIDLAGASLWTRDFAYNDISTANTFTITVEKPGLYPDTYDFIAVDKGDHDKPMPFNVARIAKSTVTIEKYTEPRKDPVHITVVPTPSDANVKIDGIPIRETDVSAGAVVKIEVTKYGYTNYYYSFVAPANYIGQILEFPVSMEPCSITEPTCGGYVPPVVRPDDSGCSAGDLLCQYKAYIPYALAGVVLLVLMMPKKSQSDYHDHPS